MLLKRKNNGFCPNGLMDKAFVFGTNDEGSIPS